MWWDRTAARAEWYPSHKMGSGALVLWWGPRWRSATRKSHCSQTAVFDGRSWTRAADSVRRRLTRCKKGGKLKINFSIHRHATNSPFFVLTAHGGESLGARRESLIKGNEMSAAVPGGEGGMDFNWIANVSGYRQTYSSGSNRELNTILTLVCTDDVVMWYLQIKFGG